MNIVRNYLLACWLLASSQCVQCKYRCTIDHCVGKPKESWGVCSLEPNEQLNLWRSVNCRKRIKDISAKSSQQGAKLFSGKVEAGDICQGQLGVRVNECVCACIRLGSARQTKGAGFRSCNYQKISL
jgi:hypothetical protein